MEIAEVDGFVLASWKCHMGRNFELKLSVRINYFSIPDSRFVYGHQRNQTYALSSAQNQHRLAKNVINLNLCCEPLPAR